jgi:hypothetical protein
MSDELTNCRSRNNPQRGGLSPYHAASVMFVTAQRVSRSLLGVCTETLLAEGEC